MPPLIYAPAIPWHKRRQWRRWTILASILFASVGISAWYGPSVWDWVKYVRLERECRFYAAPEDQVVYEEHERDVAALQVTGATYRTVAYFDKLDPRSLPQGPAYLPNRLADQIGFGDIGAALFLHERRAAKAGGASAARLVFVELWYGGPAALDASSTLRGWARPGATRALCITANSNMLGNAFSRKRVEPYSTFPGDTIPNAVETRAYFSLRADDRLRLFAGQADPQDESRFTINYELNGDPGIVQGTLRGDFSVQLNVLKGNLTFDKQQ